MRPFLRLSQPDRSAACVVLTHGLVVIQERVDGSEEARDYFVEIGPMPCARFGLALVVLGYYPASVVGKAMAAISTGVMVSSIGDNDVRAAAEAFDALARTGCG